MKHKIFFLFVKEIKSNSENKNCKGQGDQNDFYRRHRGIINRIPETLDKIIKRIQEEKRSVFFRDSFKSVNDRGEEKKCLESYSQDLLDILYFDLSHRGDKR